jgi:two-component system, LytTR family, sensor kinase
MKKRDTIADNTDILVRGFSAKRFWIWAFGIYVIAESLYWILHYVNLYKNCNSCTQPVGYYIMQCLLNFLLTALVWYCLNRFYRLGRLQTVALNIVLFVVHYTGWIWINYQIQKSGPSWLMGGELYRNQVSELIYYSWLDIGRYVLKITAFYVMKFYAEYRYTEQQRIQLALINKDLQLNLLKQQLSPHFYFNTLNNLYGLARSNNPRLPRALQQLSNIMHYVIVECNQPKVSLQKEIDFLQSYIELEKLRYEEDTVIDMQVEGRANGHTILPLMLIQFVENAFKHGMKEKSEKNWMRVKLYIHNKDIMFYVDNSYYEAFPAGGIGLSSVKHRLDLQYEGKYDMQMEKTEGQFSVKLQLDLS